MKITNYHTYFLELATQCKAIAHTDQKPKFARLELNEDILTCKSKLDTETPCLFVSLLDNSITDKFSDNVHIHTNVVMLIAKRCKTFDFQTIANTLKECEEIGYTLLSRIYKDKKEVKIQGFDRNSVSFTESFDTPQANDTGILFRFTLHRSINSEIFYNPTLWLT